MIEDSTFEGWTIPASPVMDYPDGRRLPRPPARGYLGEIRSAPKADENSIKYASRSWPQGRAEDFERDGRTWTDRATGTEYRLCRGNPLLGDDPSQADVFVVEDDSILFLIRADWPQTKTVSLGTLGGLRGTR